MGAPSDNDPVGGAAADHAASQLLKEERDRLVAEIREIDGQEEQVLAGIRRDSAHPRNALLDRLIRIEHVIAMQSLSGAIVIGGGFEMLGGYLSGHASRNTLADLLENLSSKSGKKSR